MMFMHTQPYRPGIDSISMPWSSVALFPHSLFTQEFATGTRMTAIATLLSDRAAVKITSRVFRRVKDRWNNYQSKEEVNLLVDLPHSGTLWLRMSDESLKTRLQYSLGPYARGWEGYGSIFCNRFLKGSSLRIGAVRGWEEGWLDFRVRLNVGEFKPESFLYCKGVYRGERIRGGMVLAGSLIGRLLQKNDLEMGVRLAQDHWIWGMLYCEQFRNYRINYSRLGSYFDLFKLAYVARHKQITAGVGLDYSIEDNQSRNVEAVVEYKPAWDKFKWAKVKLNTHWELSMAGEVGMGQNFKLKGSLYWFNIFKQAVPSQFSLRITYN